MVKTAETTSIEVLRAIIEDAKNPCDNPAVDAHYVIRASESVVHRLLDEDAEQLAGLARLIGCELRMQVEPSYGPGQFDISLV
jgi:ribonuclease G